MGYPLQKKQTFLGNIIIIKIDCCTISLKEVAKNGLLRGKKQYLMDCKFKETAKIG